MIIAPSIDEGLLEDMRFEVFAFNDMIEVEKAKARTFVLYLTD